MGANKRGFTLMELLVVIAIIGILAAVLIFGVRAQIAKGRDAKRKADLRKSQNALEDYYNDNGRYPLSFDCDDPFTPYLEKVPCDPQPGKEYKYVVGPDGQWYKIYANLEYESDPAIAEAGCSTGCVVDDVTYNYGVSSPNVSVGTAAVCEGWTSPTCGNPGAYVGECEACCPGGEPPYRMESFESGYYCCPDPTCP